MIDMNSLTVGEAAKVEELSGQSLDSLAETSTPKVLSMAALTYVWHRRSVKDFTWNDAMGLTMGQMRDILGMNDTEDAEDAVTFDGTVLDGSEDAGEADPFPSNSDDDS